MLAATFAGRALERSNRSLASTLAFQLLTIGGPARVVKRISSKM